MQIFALKKLVFTHTQNIIKEEPQVSILHEEKLSAPIIIKDMQIWIKVINHIFSNKPTNNDNNT